MDSDKHILQRLEELIHEASERLTDEASRAGIGPSTEEAMPALWEPWRVSALHLVAQVGGKTSEYYTSFARWFTRVASHAGGSRSAAVAVQILKRFREDYARGYLRDLRELAAAEVFTDFLDMADHFLTEGYHAAAAASVAGAVLEDCLRRLHLKHIGKWQGDSSITKLNDGLRKAEVYGQAVWRQVQVWGDIRNPADHGEWDKVEAGAVKAMVSGIRDFIAKHEG